MTADERIPLNEPFSVDDTFCTELVRIDPIGSCVRLTFAVLRRQGGTGDLERSISAYIVMPAEALADMCVKAGMACDPPVLVDSGGALEAMQIN